MHHGKAVHHLMNEWMNEVKHNGSTCLMLLTQHFLQIRGCRCTPHLSCCPPKASETHQTYRDGSGAARAFVSAPSWLKLSKRKSLYVFKLIKRTNNKYQKSCLNVFFFSLKDYKSAAALTHFYLLSLTVPAVLRLFGHSGQQWEESVQRVAVTVRKQKHQELDGTLLL